MSAAIGTLGKLGIGAASPVTYALDFQSEGIVKRQESVNGNGVRGTRSHTVERTRAGLQRIGGPLSLQPNSADIHQLLPWVLGTNGTVVSGTNKQYILAEGVQSRYVTVDRHAKVFTYATTGVDRCTIRGDQGALVGFDLDLIAATESVGNAGTFPAIYTDVTTNPFILSDLTLSVNSTSVTAKGFEVSISNDIDRDRFFNSNTLTALVARDREVTFKTRLPYGDFTALYDLGAATGIAVTATLTNGTSVMVVTMPKVVFPPMSPRVEGRTEVMLDLEGRAYRYGDPSDATKAEIIVTLDTGA